LPITGVLHGCCSVVTHYQQPAQLTAWKEPPPKWSQRGAPLLGKKERQVSRFTLSQMVAVTVCLG